MKAARVHLVRHGEVENPAHVVYADLPGFGLSDRGRRQAAGAARHLSTTAIGKVVSSPLQRAVETARAVAGDGAGVELEPDLTEWLLASRWAGTVWAELPQRRPGELEAYLEHPHDLAFSPESLLELGRRVSIAIERHAAELQDDLVVVSHQDPVQAAVRMLTGAGFERFHDSKPGHACVITLQRRQPHWTVIETWQPAQGEPFPPPS